MYEDLIRRLMALEAQTANEEAETLRKAVDAIDDLVEDRNALRSELTAEMLMLWREYAMADDSTLTPAAKRLGAELLAAFDARVSSSVKG